MNGLGLEMGLVLVLAKSRPAQAYMGSQSSPIGLPRFYFTSKSPSSWNNYFTSDKLHSDFPLHLIPKEVILDCFSLIVP